MNGDSPMRPLGRWFGLLWFWASPQRDFLRPGIYVWAFRRNLRIVPLRRRHVPLFPEREEASHGR